MDDKLLDILCCPVSRKPLKRLDEERSRELARAIDEGKVQFVDGSAVERSTTQALVTDDEQVIYQVNDGIPVLLPESGIGTQQFDDFAAGRL